jgi:hypothetical protein
MQKAHVVSRPFQFFPNGQWSTWFCCKPNIMYREMEKAIRYLKLCLISNCMLSIYIGLSLQESQAHYSKERKMLI